MGASGWVPWPGTEMAITSEQPVSMSNRHAVCLSTKVSPEMTWHFASLGTAPYAKFSLAEALVTCLLS